MSVPQRQHVAELMPDPPRWLARACRPLGRFRSIGTLRSEWIDQGRMAGRRRSARSRTPSTPHRAGADPTIRSGPRCSGLATRLCRGGAAAQEGARLLSEPLIYDCRSVSRRNGSRPQPRVGNRSLGESSHARKSLIVPSKCPASPLVSHSHITSTRQPFSRNIASFRRSRWTFPSSLRRQKSDRVLGNRFREQPSCRCQKQPCTKIALRCGRNTRSGRPGKSFA